ncbi:hypothetical protein JCM19294_536 [Nonlabens tegetincola]|uniref:Uncharacterized protein n=1 Tax=Nonlabens tegetincola TaxID=323273 RepID=A0A090Q210_9FLAO|nr:hypothetical protein JCM19294_536 [Nonlabens tegetincola]
MHNDYDFILIMNRDFECFEHLMILEHYFKSDFFKLVQSRFIFWSVSTIIISFKTDSL